MQWQLPACQLEPEDAVDVDVVRCTATGNIVIGAEKGVLHSSRSQQQAYDAMQVTSQAAPPRCTSRAAAVCDRDVAPGQQVQQMLHHTRQLLSFASNLQVAMAMLNEQQRKLATCMAHARQHVAWRLARSGQ